MNRLKQFWERYGYICVLSVCVAMVAVTAVLTRAPQEVGEAPEVVRYAVETPKPSKQSVQVDAVVRPEATPVVFAMPCEGKAGMRFSDDGLVYNRTLHEYAVHEGLDILTQENEPVRSIEDGTVTGVWMDERLGQCVEVTHRSGYVSAYCSLQEGAMVEADDAVSRGQILGIAGVSASAECAEGPHVHIALRRGRVLLDPEKYLQESLS